MKLTSFQVWSFRNILNSGLIRVNDITSFVGQNEAGKSNLFDALYRLNPFDGESGYSIDEDWPVSNWGNKDLSQIVCLATFLLSKEDTGRLEEFINNQEVEEDIEALKLPDEGVELEVRSYYDDTLSYRIIIKGAELNIDNDLLEEWASNNLPKFVLIHDYDLAGNTTELDQLQRRKNETNWDNLTVDEQTILIILELANINIDDFVEKGQTSEGRTIRTFDKKTASAYLTKQFQDLWSQKKVRFEIEIDGTTLNIFAEDDSIGMPVRLHRRSTGFRWYVSFAWKFTHASKGDFKDCILLLEEPGIHLHYSAQQDLLEVFERLKTSNTILYTTHLASMLDAAYPERIRIVEEASNGGGTIVRDGIVSTKRAPMAVIEARLGLVGNLSGLLGNRNTLIVEGGDDVLILNKLSAILKDAGQVHLDSSIYLWPAETASKTPMYAAFAIGQKWSASVLLDSDGEGIKAKEKIADLFLSKLSEGQIFKVLMIGEAAGIKQTDASIEDLFPVDFYVELVNDAYKLNIKLEDLAEDGTDMISKRVENVLKKEYGISNFDKGRILIHLLKRFDTWKSVKDLPSGTEEKAAKLFDSINHAFKERSPKKTKRQ